MAERARRAGSAAGCGAAALVSAPLARPLRKVQGKLAEWRSGERLQLNEQVPEELAPLVAEINHLGQQIESVLERARNSGG
ncbi:hypothetical protein ULG90_08185 [Halopseudomonas pachastrellae]|nr:hypothetical protein ULG90_08185 [Halopseudomonas pachastrellae]